MDVPKLHTLATRLARPVVYATRSRSRLFVRDHLRKWCADRELPVDTAYGFRMLVSPRDYISYGIFFFGDYDPRMSDALCRFLEPCQTCWDIGTERGWFTLLMAERVGSRGRVRAFEALPDNVERLRANIALNGFDHAVIHAAAVSGAPGTVHFEPPSRGAAPEAHLEHCGGVGFITREPTDRAIDVSAVTLDGVADETGTAELHMLKMDIEGAEVAALRGGAATIEKFRPMIAVEYNRATLQRAGTSMDELDETLAGLGYDRLFCRADGTFRRVDIKESADKPDHLAVFNVYAFHRDDPRKPVVS